MKRTDFEAQFESLGLNLGPYAEAAYYGACKEWSLSLHPFPTNEVKHAKLAVNTASVEERTVIVDTFLSAAEVKKTPQIEEAIETGGDFRGKVGAKEVCFTSIGSELVLNVME